MKILKNGALAATAAGVGLGISSIVVSGNPLDVPRAIIQDIFDVCDDPDPALVQSFESRIRASLAGQPVGTSAESAALTTGNTSGVRRAMSQNPDQAVSLLSGYTEATYGFEVFYDNNADPKQQPAEAEAVLNQLSRVPVEFMRAISERALDEVNLGVDTGEKTATYNYLFGRSAEISANNVENNLLHEVLGHAAATAASKENCWGPTASYPDVAAVNPSNFSYGDGKPWSGVTVTEYASSEEAEDIAEIAEVIAKDTLVERKSDVIIGKASLVLASWEELTPGTGTHFLGYVG